MSAITDRSLVLRLVVGVAVVWTLFQLAANRLQSYRGEAGLAVAAIVVLALLVVSRLLHGTPARVLPLSLGLGVPRLRGMLVALATAASMLLYFPVYAWAVAVPPETLPQSGVLVVGIFMQAGVAEEALFRGYLFGRLRERHPFWTATWLSMLPFALVHLVLFATLPLAIAAASFALAVVISFPLARLFELGGNTIWAPAVVHAAAQAIKLFEPSDAMGAGFAVGWMLLCALLPWWVFLVPSERTKRPHAI